MQLIFIRHGEPNYEIDSLTEAGWREARLLAARIVREKWPVTDIFCSPLGRAQATAQPTLEALGRSAETMPWLREFGCGEFVPPDGNKDTKGVPWDFFPSYWTADPRFGDREHWMETPAMQMQPERIEARFAEVTDGVDGVLARYGYVREKCCYRVAADAKRDAVLVFFWRDITRIISRWFQSLTGRVPRDDPDARMGWIVILGTIPIVVAGLAAHGLTAACRRGGRRRRG